MYKLYVDEAHAWLRVPREELVKYDLEHKITSYSYQQGLWVFLEEDVDAAWFVDASGLKLSEVEEVYHDTSPVRQYQHYTTKES